MTFFKHDKIKYDHLLGVPFEFGTNDCYEAGRRLFRDNTPIELPDYARPNDFWLGVEELYLDNFQKEGFRTVQDFSLDKLQPLDVFLVALPDPRRVNNKIITNHCAVYVGGGMVFHHRLGRLSECVQYKGVLREYTTHVIRHKDVPKLEEKRENLDIMSKLLPHKRALLEKALASGNQFSKDSEKDSQ